MSAYARQLSAAARQHESTCDCCDHEPDAPPVPDPRARDWEFRRRLRVLKGRPEFGSTVTRIDPHSHNWRLRLTFDTRGFDPLERMSMNRKPSRLPLPPEFNEYRAREYAEARGVSSQRTLHTLAQRESDLRVVAAYRELPFYYS